MEIVIKIHEKDYQAIKNGHIPFSVHDAIMKGTPLPEHHGRLIDADELLDKKQDYGEGQSTLILIDPYYVRKAPTIIEGSESE